MLCTGLVPGPTGLKNKHVSRRQRQKLLDPLVFECQSYFWLSISIFGGSVNIRQMQVSLFKIKSYRSLSADRENFVKRYIS